MPVAPDPLQPYDASDASNMPRSDRKRRPMSTQPHKQSSNLTGAALYLRWLGILCAVMAAFCLGVFIIGYKDPSFGRIATFIALAIASPVLLWLSRRLR